MFTIISMYTINTPYEQEVKRLLKSCQDQGYTPKVYPVKNLGQWELNCGQKPTIIRNAIEELRTNVLWLDADAVITGSLDYFNYIRQSFACCAVTKDRYRSGTVFVKNDREGKRICDRWMQAQAKSPMTFDQETMGKIITMPEHSNWHNLPEQYCHIFDARIGHCGIQPVIIHNQASRRFKNKLGDSK